MPKPSEKRRTRLQKLLNHLSLKTFKEFWCKNNFKYDLIYVCYFALLIQFAKNFHDIKEEQACYRSYGDEICWNILTSNYDNETQPRCLDYRNENLKPNEIEEIVEIEFFNSYIGLECYNKTMNIDYDDDDDVIEVVLHKNPISLKCSQFSFDVLFSFYTTHINLTRGDLKLACYDYKLNFTTQHSYPDRFLMFNSPPCYDYAFCKMFEENEEIFPDIAKNLVHAFFLMIAGTISDRYNKRILFLILPLASLPILYSVKVFPESFVNMNINWLLAYNLYSFSESIFWTTLYSFITLVTPAQDRLYRFCLIGILSYSIIAVGAQMKIPSSLSNGNLFSLQLLFSTAVIIFIIFFIEELKPIKKFESTEPTPPTPAPESLVTKSKKSSLNSWRVWTVLPLIIETLTFPIVNYKNYERHLCCLLIFACFLTVGPFMAPEFREIYMSLLTFRPVVGIFKFVPFLVTIAVLISIIVMSKMSNFSDSTIGIITAWSVPIMRFIYLATDDSSYFFISGFANLLVIKVVLSNIVRPQDVGKMYAWLLLSELLGIIAFDKFYEFIHEAKLAEDTYFKTIWGLAFSLPIAIVFQLCHFLIGHANRLQENKKLKINLEN